MFEVEISKSFHAKQGLSSPVRAEKGLPSLASEDGFAVTLKVGIAFRDGQLNDRGWFVDTDAIDEIVGGYTEYLGSAVWTELFEVPRPTFELVAKQTYQTLQLKINQLAYVELYNETIDVRTRYHGD